MTIRAAHQLVAALSPGDAVGNEALVFQELLRARGYESEIFAGAIDPAMTDFGKTIFELEKTPARDDAALIFHYAIGTPAADVALSRPERLILRYHNVTPYEFFLPFNDRVARLCYEGAERLRVFAARVALGIGVSEFNRLDLQETGFPKTAVLPLAMNKGSLAAPPDPFVASLYEDDRKNVLFVGRVAPNKKIEDLVRVFCAYQRYVEPLSRLIVVGDGRGFDNYTRRLDELVSHLRLDEVVFTGAVTQNELNAYYGLADVFLCLSEHEGYGAPLVEAMRFGVPVVAYDAGAVRETLNGGGILLKDKDPIAAAELLGALVEDERLRQSVLASQAMALDRIDGIDIGAGLQAAIQKVEEAA